MSETETTLSESNQLVLNADEGPTGPSENGSPAQMPTKRPTGREEELDDDDVQGEEAAKTLTPEERVRRARTQSDRLRARLKEAEQRLQEAAPLVKAAQEAEEANKTEVQRAQERAAQLEKDYTTLQQDNWRLDLAVQYGVPRDEIDLIGSGSREEMEARATRLGPLFATSEKTPAPPSNRPVEGLRPGALPEPPKPADNSYPAEWGFSPPRNT